MTTLKDIADIAIMETDLISALDAKNLVDLRERQPEIAACIERLTEAGYDAEEIGRLIRRYNPQMWVESKFAESCARALISELD